MRIYIAGALSSKENTERDPSRVVTDYISNLSQMCRVASDLRRKGHSPYVPGLDFMLGVVNGDWREDDYRTIGMKFLEVCDAVLVISQSWGVSQEVEKANKLGLPVYYSVEEIRSVTN